APAGRSRSTNGSITASITTDAVRLRPRHPALSFSDPHRVLFRSKSEVVGRRKARSLAADRSEFKQVERLHLDALRQRGRIRTRPAGAGIPEDSAARSAGAP